MTSFVILAIHALVTMTTLSVGTESRIQNPMKISLHAVLWTTQIWIRAKYVTYRINGAKYSRMDQAKFVEPLKNLK